MKRRAALRGATLFFAGTLLACADKGSAPGPSAPTDDAPPPPPVLAIVSATVIAMDGEAPHPDHTIVVQEDRIVAFGPDDEVEVPVHARVVDADDAFVIPGLTDMHVHNWFPQEHALMLAHGVTTVRVMWGAPVHLRWRDEIRKGERLGPDIVTTGPIIDGAPPVWQGSAVVESVDAARETVRAHHAAGYDQIKLYAHLPRDAFLAAIDEAHQLGMRAVGHVPDRVPLRDALEHGYDGIEHLTGYVIAMVDEDAERPPELLERPFGAQMRWTAEHLDAAAMGPLATTSAEHEVWNTPTLVVMQKMMASERAAHAFGEAEALKWTPAVYRFAWNSMMGGAGEPAPEDLEASRKWFDALLAMTKALHDAGAGLLVGTDLANPYIVAGDAVHEELGLFVRAGLTPTEALEAATVNPASFLGREGKHGVVAPGAVADLVVLDADPTVSIANTRTILAVVVRGQVLDREKLDEMLDEVAEYFARTPFAAPQGPGAE